MGSGGIEAESSMLGYPTHIQIPEVVGVELKGSLPEGSLATDLALNITQLLRKEKVLGKFIEFFGEGLKSLTLDDRATIANMAPEYGATCAFFPIDSKTIDYMLLTGRTKSQAKMVETYSKKNSLWYSHSDESPKYNSIVKINLKEIYPTISGPYRPQDTINISESKTEFESSLSKVDKNMQSNNFATDSSLLTNDDFNELKSGDVVIAAITACTNTSNSNIMITAGLLAKNAITYGLTVPNYVKTSLAPGSKVVTKYLNDSGLIDFLEQLGFYVVGYGCTTCSGNSGPLNSQVEKTINRKNINVSSILSGNRNFEGRIHPLVKFNYLASPPLVIAYAIAGTINIDLTSEPIGKSVRGENIFLKDIWPGDKQVSDIKKEVLTPDIFKSEYQDVFEENNLWKEFNQNNNKIYKWDDYSTYIKNPPFITSEKTEPKKRNLNSARILALFGDSLTTDHISPVGPIPLNSPAGKYLQSCKVSPRHFNSYGARRGNHEVMTRGTFANPRIKNLLLYNKKEGGYTVHFPTNEVTSIYEAAMRYKQEKTDLIIMAGKDYGMGSSRDWAAKGTKLLGVKAIIAESFERIHRSNLVMMGVLPLQLVHRTKEELNISGNEYFNIYIPENIQVNEMLRVEVFLNSQVKDFFQVKARLDNKLEIKYYNNNGILPLIYNEIIKTVK